jgi:hypothetical protein
VDDDCRAILIRECDSTVLLLNHQVRAVAQDLVDRIPELRLRATRRARATTGAAWRTTAATATAAAATTTSATTTTTAAAAGAAGSGDTQSRRCTRTSAPAFAALARRSRALALGFIDLP